MGCRDVRRVTHRAIRDGFWPCDQFEMKICGPAREGPRLDVPVVPSAHQSFKFFSGIPLTFEHESVGFVDDIENIWFTAGQFSCAALCVEDCYRPVLTRKCVQIFVSRVHDFRFQPLKLVLRSLY
jgi:hypothetical protein